MLVKFIFLIYVLGTFVSGDEPKEVRLIKRNDKIICLGALISKEIIATSASCVYGVPKEELKIEIEGYENVKKIEMHPYYSHPKLNYDIAVLRFSTNKPEKLFLVSLVDKELTPSDTVYAVNNISKTELVEIEDRTSCKSKLQNNVTVSGKMICVKLKFTTENGSPLLMKKKDGSYLLAGFYSHRSSENDLIKIFVNVANSEIKSFLEGWTS